MIYLECGEILKAFSSTSINMEPTISKKSLLEKIKWLKLKYLLVSRRQIWVSLSILISRSQEFALK